MNYLIDQVNSQIAWGDPCIVGFTIFGLYLASSALCFYILISNRIRTHNYFKKIESLLWMSLALAMLFLGLNKQLDLQTLFISLGRKIAKAQGWYYISRFVQAVFAIFFSVSVVIFLLILLLGLKKHVIRNKAILSGTLLMTLYIVISAFDYSHLLPRSLTVGNDLWELFLVLLELAGVSTILCGIIVEIRTKKMRLKALNKSN